MIVAKQLSEKAAKLIASLDEKLNKRCGWSSNSLAGNAEKLLQFGMVEVGWRESCGTTDFTSHVYSGWRRVVKQLLKDGFTITEERQKHGNSYATLSGGFWSSIVYRLTRNET